MTTPSVPPEMLAPAAALDQPQAVRHAGRDLLSLALIDARNRTLRLFAAFEVAHRLMPADTSASPDGPPMWWLGHLGWYQETWIARNVQRHRGRLADAHGVRLASIDPRADLWWDPRQRRAGLRHGGDLPTPETVRQYLVDTLEVTLELLDETAETDDALYVFRDALFHEDRQAERLLEAAQHLGVPVDEALQPAARVPRMPLMMAGGTARIGIPDDEGGYRFEAERGTQLAAFPEHDIDAQPVSWQQYLEFVADGGYRHSQWWSPAGWDWLCRSGRRGPLAAEDLTDPLAQTRFGRSLRIAAPLPVVHVNAHEAQAWCRWAGRRLPSEAEWVHAAQHHTARGFRWGEVWEWTADRLADLRAGDHDPCNLPAREAFLAACGRHRVLRGGSTATRARLRDPRHRHHRDPADPAGFTGFRSCAI